MSSIPAGIDALMNEFPIRDVDLGLTNDFMGDLAPHKMFEKLEL